MNRCWNGNSRLNVEAEKLEWKRTTGQLVLAVIWLYVIQKKYQHGGGQCEVARKTGR